MPKKYLSGRVERTSQTDLTDDRYEYLGLEQAEPNLGDPLVGPSSIAVKPVPPGQQYMIVSTGNPGERYWIPNQGGIIPGSITVYNQNIGSGLVGGLSSTTQLVFIGSAINVTAPYAGPPYPPNVNITISPPGNNGDVLFKELDDFATSSKLVFNSSVGILTIGNGLNVGSGGTIFTIKPTGLVGIGTSSPTQELDVNGDIRLRGTIYDYNNNSGNNSEILVKNNLGGVSWNNQSSIRAGAGGTYTQIQYHNASGLVDGATGFVYDPNTNRVGIGSTLPRYILDVIGTVNISGLATITNLYVSGIGTFNDIEQSTSTSTGALVVSGGVGIAKNLNVGGVAGISSLNVTNHTTSGSLYVSGISTLGVTTATNLTAQTLRVSGISTLGVTTTTNLTAQTLRVSGISTLGVTSTTNLTSQTLNVSGISTLGVTTTTNLTSQTLRVSGISTLGVTSTTNLTAQSIVVSGISTLGVTSATNLTSQTLRVSGISTLGVTSTTNLTAQSLVVSGISTFYGNILPGSDDFYDIGNVLVKFNEIYANTFIGQIIGNAETATVAINVNGGTGNLTALNVSGISTLGVTTATNLTSQSLVVSGIGTITNLNSTNGTITTFNSTNGTITNLTGTGVTYTNGTITNLTGIAGTITTLNSTNGTITNLTGTAGTITTFNSTNGTITNLTGTAGTITTFNSTNGTITNLTGTGVTYTNGTITTFNSTTGIITNVRSTTINNTGIGTITTLNSTNGTITTLNSTTGIITNLTGTGVTYTNGTFTNLSAGSISYTNSNATNLYATNGYITVGIVTTISGTNLNYTNGTITNLTGTGVTYTNGTITNLTGIAGTITTLNSTNGTITNLTGTAGTITTFNSTTGIITNVRSTTINNTGIGTITTLNSTTGTITNLTGTAGTITTFNSTNGTITNLTGTAGTITTLNSTTGIITNLTGTGVTYTNGTFTNLSAGSISYTNSNATNLYATNGYITVGIVTTISGTNLNYTNGTITNLTGTGVTYTNGTITNLTGTGVTYTNGTITNLNSTNGTITNLTGTNLNITGISTFQGNVTLGDANTDKVSFGATVDSNIIPSGSRDLGSVANPWSNVYATTITGTIAGNAATATRLATPRNIDIDGDVIGVGIGTTFDGSQNVTIQTTLKSQGLTPSVYGSSILVPVIGVNAAGIVTSITTTGVNFTTATVLRAAGLTTARTIAITGDLAYTSPAFDGTGNVTGISTLATVNSNVGTFGSSTFVPQITVNAKGLVTGITTTGVNFTTATVLRAAGLTTARTIAITGDLAYTSPAFDGTGNVTAVGILSTTAVTAGSYGSGSQVATFTVDAKGRLTAASNTSITGINASSVAAAGADTQIQFNDGGAFAGDADFTFAKTTNTVTTRFLALNGNGSTTSAQLAFNGGTNNWITFGTTGVAAPAFTTRSVGTKIVLYDGIGASSADYGFGIESSTLWSSVPTTSNQFKWYGGTTNIASLFGTGELVVGTTTKTGTASQPLQVTGGAYVSGSVGIGTTTPTSKLHVVGDARVTGVVTATTFIGALTGTATSTTNIPNLTGAITSVNTTTSLGSFSSANLATALTDKTGTGANVFATSPTLVTPALGTPSSGNLTSCTGLPISTGVSGLAANVATFLATPSSANLAAALTDETGTGANVFATSPTLVTPALGTPSSGNLANCTGFPTLNQNTTGNANTATTATTATYLNTANSSSISDNITNRINSGFWETSTATTGEGWPTTTNSYYHLISSTHSNPANYYALQLAAPFYTQNLYYRSTDGSGSTAWKQVDAFASGTTIVFYQASAPTGWTRSSSHDNKALRVVSGTGGGSGGSSSFTSVFASRGVPLLQHNHSASSDTHAGHQHSGPTNNQNANHTHTFTTNSVGDHNHLINGYITANEAGGYGFTGPGGAFENRVLVTASGGQGTTYAGGHDHGGTTAGMSNDHYHDFQTQTGGSHGHTITVANNGTASASMDFAVQYIDVIICSKN